MSLMANCDIRIQDGHALNEARFLEQIYQFVTEHATGSRNAMMMNSFHRVRRSPRVLLFILFVSCIIFLYCVEYESYTIALLSSETPNLRASPHQGGKGGAWAWCTHIQIYGLNFDLGLASFLVHQLSPTSAFEFGSGIGLYVDYLKREGHLKRVVGSEPEDMSSAGIYGREGGPQQLTGNLLDVLHAEQRQDLQNDKFDLVYSIEVVEHIDAFQIPILIDFLTSIAGKYVVFSAAQPGQEATGHMPDSMLTREEWISRFEATGRVKYLPLLSKMLLEQADSRNVNHKKNPVVFGASIDLDTIAKHPKLQRSSTRFKEEHEATAYTLFPIVKKSLDMAVRSGMCLQ